MREVPTPATRRMLEPGARCCSLSVTSAAAIQPSALLWMYKVGCGPAFDSAACSRAYCPSGRLCEHWGIGAVVGDRRGEVIRVPQTGLDPSEVFARIVCGRPIPPEPVQKGHVVVGDDAFRVRPLEKEQIEKPLQLVVVAEDSLVER